MNNPQKNNYIQFVNELGKVQTTPVIFTDDGVNTSFVVQGIKENFFITGVYQNNIQVYGIGFDDIENNDMLAFINSNIIDLDCIPNNSFLNAFQIVTMSYNNDYVKNFQKSQVTLPNNEVLAVSQKTNERLFFEEYLRVKFPLRTFTVEPFLLVQQNIYPIDRRVYYAKSSGYSCNLKNHFDDYFLHGLSNTDTYQLFTEITTSNGTIQNFSGYVAISDEPLFDLTVYGGAL